MYITHIQHRPFQWMHAAGSPPHRCDLDLFLFGTRALVVAGEREEQGGSGMSITNGAAILATIVLQKYRLDPKHLSWIEHHPERSLGGSRIYRMAEVYHQVTFAYQGNRFVNPRWESLDREGARAFIEALKTPVSVLEDP